MKEMFVNTPERVDRAERDYEDGVLRKRPVIFADILASSLPEHEKSKERLLGEAFSVMSAGTETSSWTMAIITYHVLSQPEVQAKLSGELKSVDLDSVSWLELEKPPYLSAVIAEGLRLSYGIPSRLARIAPQEDLMYRDKMNGSQTEYVIPRGTAIGMSSAIMHDNEDVFSQSAAFLPERWMSGDAPQRAAMEKSFLAFSKGSRQCVGIKYVSAFNVPLNDERG
ncbi:hypothetical protein E8E11_001192 [Didymella keratinophila]|nr:hypothetical protein E8E11_001192 [Didymella keratinophila]